MTDRSSNNKDLLKDIVAHNVIVKRASEIQQSHKFKTKQEQEYFGKNWNFQKVKNTLFPN